MIRSPIKFLKNIEIIKRDPETTSDSAILEANTELNPKYFIRPSGGNGNLSMPWKIKANPSPNLKNKRLKKEKFLRKASNHDINFFKNILLI